jgi:hypothetical protein
VRRALDDPFHPSMQFKPLVGNVWFARIGDHYRTVAQKHSDLVVWFWIGTKTKTTSSNNCVAVDLFGQRLAGAADRSREVFELGQAVSDRKNRFCIVEVHVWFERKIPQSADAHIDQT